MFESRCGCCGIKVEAKNFKKHTESISHKIQMYLVLHEWVNLNIEYKENPNATMIKINTIRIENGIKPMGMDYDGSI
jgi:hypothetical protein